MSRPFPFWVRVSRQGGGTTDRNTGRWTPDPEAVLYNGRADVQDEGAVTSLRASTSEAVQESRATVYLPDHVDVSAFSDEDVVEVFWHPREPDADAGETYDQDAEIVRTVRIDQKILVRYL